MFRILWFAVKVGVVVAAAVWVANRPGLISLSWMDYTVEAQAWFALVVVMGGLLILLALHRFLLSVLGLSGAFGRYRDYRKQIKGQRALVLGMSAVAAGDRKLAQHQAHRARRLLPRDRGLTVLLEADSARLTGDEAGAHAAYNKLLSNKDTAFLGMRGLLASALDRGQADEALPLARKALGMQPKQSWLLRLVYRLELRERRWDDALRTLRRVERAKAFPSDVTRSDRQAILIQQARDSFENAQGRAGMEKLKQAYRIDPGFVPAALALAERYIESGDRRAAVRLVGKSWQISPHPELAALWKELAPLNKAQDFAIRLRWFEKLVALRPDHVESQLAAAQAAIDDRLWGEARQYISAAEAIKHTSRAYQMRAAMEEQLGHPGEAHYWMDKAANADPDPVWTCRETGQIYERWSPVAEPHGAFNTIIWGFPVVRMPAMIPLQASDQPSLMLASRLRA
jgi:HemY protein